MRVLIAEDNEDLRCELRDLLTSEGHRTAVAQSGEEVLSRLKASPYDIVLLDWKMPGPAGVELVERAKALRPTAAIVVMTGYGDVDTAVAAFRSGAVDFLRKPFDFEAVQRALSGAGHSAPAAPGVMTPSARRPGRRRATRTADVRAAFLNYRGGTLVGHRLGPREKIIDEDILTGMLDAIQQFMRTSFPVLRGKRLRAIVQGDYTLLIERGRYVHLSLVVCGPDSDALRRRMRARIREFEARNEKALQRWRGDLAEATGVDEVLAAFLPA